MHGSGSSQWELWRIAVGVGEIVGCVGATGRDWIWEEKEHLIPL